MIRINCDSARIRLHHLHMNGPFEQPAGRLGNRRIIAASMADIEA